MKRLEEYLAQLESLADLIDKNVSNWECFQSLCEEMKQILDVLLSSSMKSFEVTVDGRVFDFYYPTTQQEKNELNILRKELIDIVVDAAIFSGNWDYVLAFASGIDPLDMQVEKIDMAILYNVTDSNGELVKSIPLNLESSYVDAQRPGKQGIDQFDEELEDFHDKHHNHAQDVLIKSMDESRVI